MSRVAAPRFSALVLAVVMTGSILLGVEVLARQEPAAHVMAVAAGSARA